MHRRNKSAALPLARPLRTASAPAQTLKVATRAVASFAIALALGLLLLHLYLNEYAPSQQQQQQPPASVRRVAAAARALPFVLPPKLVRAHAAGGVLHTSPAECEQDLRVLCMIPIAPRTSSKFEDELETGKQLAALLLGIDTPSAHLARRRCDGVRLYTTGGKRGIRTTRLVLVKNHEPDARAQLIDLTLVHAPDSYTNLWEKVHTMFSHAWAAELETLRNNARRKVEQTHVTIGANILRFTPPSTELCAEWSALGVAFPTLLVPCTQACQTLSNDYGAAHRKSEWGQLLDPTHARLQKWWLRANCATDPDDETVVYDWMVKLDLDSLFVGENFRAMACEPRFDVDAPLALGHRATHRNFPMLLGCGYAINYRGMERLGPALMALAFTKRLNTDPAPHVCVPFATQSEDAAISKCILVINVSMPFTRDAANGGEFFIPNTAGAARHSLPFFKAGQDHLPHSEKKLHSWYWKGKRETWHPRFHDAPRAFEHCCATRTALAHGYKGHAARVLRRVYELEVLRAAQQPERPPLDINLLVQAELVQWQTNVEYEPGHARSNASIFGMIRSRNGSQTVD